jgi:hypothetical protein
MSLTFNRLVCKKGYGANLGDSNLVQRVSTPSAHCLGINLGSMQWSTSSISQRCTNINLIHSYLRCTLKSFVVQKSHPSPTIHFSSDIEYGKNLSALRILDIAHSNRQEPDSQHAIAEREKNTLVYRNLSNAELIVENSIPRPLISTPL